jgi:hypothetical protein
VIARLVEQHEVDGLCNSFGEATWTARDLVGDWLATWAQDSLEAKRSLLESLIGARRALREDAA